ncbi:hypothetical protein BWQ96_01605 [Gracilariopsis chorda]|uniref:RRM domain-containing protein n=1 Tax=Gracilariopsis chorda TaxID=448386 RepID=A0A2V3J344_9FLOR|nr:hypothetical protein BWQ96_01605 [Gracilariopsis chorda]|eukprot:PXF48753.1 hypothetical protein BWQ96_01605 [Gracilariopsis chorda]
MSFAFGSRFRLLHQPARTISRNLTNDAAPRIGASKHYVRIAGPASYASRCDVLNFLQEQSALPSTSPSVLVQGQADIYQNHSVWLYDAGSQDTAEQVASKISGKVMGLKLIRAAAVDKKIADSMLDPPERGARTRTTLRRRLNLISPSPDERGRSLLATSLPPLLKPRHLWSFFASYDVVDVRLLRKSGVSCIVFTTEAEAERALRERSNISLHGMQTISLKMHD